MKTISLKAFGLILVLGVQVFAQRFTTTTPDSFETGRVELNMAQQGYISHNLQAAVLGEKKSSFANLMLIGDLDDAYHVVNSHGNVWGTVFPIASGSCIGAVVVLDSLSDSKKTATVLFASYNKLTVMQINITEANAVSYSVLRSMDMPEFMAEPARNHYYGVYRRLTLMGINISGTEKIYHIAISNSNSKNESGRVDFFSLNENSWTFSQSNGAGLASGINGLFFESYSRFGKDLVSISDLDKNGYNELAVLLSESPQYPYSAIYIFFMDNEYTPSSKPPVIITGSSAPWLDNPEQVLDCAGLSKADWGSEDVRLLMSCNTKSNSDPLIRGIIIKELVLNSSGNLVSASTFAAKEINYKSNAFFTGSNPLSLKNHKNDLNSVSLAINGPHTIGVLSSVLIFPVMDADYSKNFSLEAGKPEIIINLDSLFYKSGTIGFSAKTLSGLVQCGIQGNNLICEGEENAIGSWSSLELSSRSDCDAYKECKRKDTIFVYIRFKNEKPNTALRIPKHIIIPFFSQINLGNVKSFLYFKNPDLQNTVANWNTNGMKLSTVMGNFSIIPFSQKEGIDTLVFNLSISATTDSYPVYLHVADTAKIFDGEFQDTVWNTAQKRYIALPRSSSGGNLYTYDIAQDNLGIYAEITGNYLHILKVDVADILVAYTENAEIKHRKITLMPEPKPLPPNAVAISQSRNLKAVQVKGGLQISGINGEFELTAYDLKGKEVQRARAWTSGSVFVELRYKGPQIARIKSGNQITTILLSLLD
ncbi:MAG: hypothetical protein FWB90_04235 [Fibromonadales bacterium]|nr:hypothetical protein [Fibromonadales bacterium]